MSTRPYVPPRAAWNQAAGRNWPPTSTNPPHRTGGGVSGQKSPPANPPQAGNGYEDAYSVHYGSQPPADGGYEATGRARSPSESERSNLTPISQRGVNPRWNPRQMQGRQHQNAPPRRMAQQQKQRRQDMLLDNPDFQLPGNRSKGGAHRAGPGMVPGGAYPGNAL